MRFAVISDIHGNRLALEAVLEDIGRQGVEMQAVVNLGDCFSGPLDAVGTGELLCDLPMLTVRGNHDRYLIEQRFETMQPSDAEAFRQLRSEHFDWLRALPVQQTWHDEVFLCHAMPNRDDIYWLETVTDNGIVHAKARAEIEAAAVGLRHSLILCGHSHLPRAVRLSDGRLIVNPGSVGCPAYDDHEPVYHRVEAGHALASYAIVEKRLQAWNVSFRAISYDHMAMARLAAEKGREDWAAALASGWFA